MASVQDESSNSSSAQAPSLQGEVWGEVESQFEIGKDKRLELQISSSPNGN